MSKYSAAAFSSGDVMRRLRETDREMGQLRTARSLQAASIGAGGLRIHSGGGIVVQGADGQGDVFRVGSDPVELFLRPELVSSLVQDIVEELLTSEAGQELAAFVLSSRVHEDTVDATESTTSTTFTDLGTVGPTVPGVQVTASGKAIVTLSANLVSDSTPQMSFEVSGASTRVATDDRALIFGLGGSPFGVTLSRQITLTGLNEGEHEIVAKYRDLNGNTSNFADRTISVIAF